MYNINLSNYFYTNLTIEVTDSNSPEADIQIFSGTSFEIRGMDDSMILVKKR